MKVYLTCWKCGRLYYHGVIMTNLCNQCTPKVTIKISDSTKCEVAT